jgi:hypothetical protein
MVDRILQIIPADGWKAVFASPDGYILDPLMAITLAEGIDDQGRTFTYIGGSCSNLADKVDSGELRFVAYVPPEYDEEKVRERFGKPVDHFGGELAGVVMKSWNVH